MDKPIPVSVSLPEHKPWPDGERVLAFVPEKDGAYGTWFIAACYDGEWMDDCRGEETLPNVTHWMPLPPNP